MKRQPRYVTYYYDSQTDDRRAKIADSNKPLIHHSRLVIRAERGQGELLFERVYTTHRGARRALSRLGSKWSRYKKSIII